MKQKKIQERIYAERAVDLLAEEWRLIDREGPDFEVSNGRNIWGLELRSIFKSEDPSGGSREKKQESHNSRSLAELARQYYDEISNPIQLKVWGASSIGHLAPNIRSTLLDRIPGPPWSHHKLAITDTLILYITDLPDELSKYSRWLLIDDRVGFIRRITKSEIQNAINAKLPKLKQYFIKYQRVDLIIVADRTFNSGRMVWDDTIRINNPGFTNIYYLSYPESIQTLDDYKD